jgi:putative transposase
MPSGLRRYHQDDQLHFITFSCYRRQPKLSHPAARDTFEQALEQARGVYGFGVIGYVVMPEHVHLLVGEPETKALSRAVQSLKQSVARRLGLRAGEPFWQARYYDFNVWSGRKRVEKLRYIHRNPVTRGLVKRPEDWPWSSYRHYATGVDGVVEIESEWTGFRRQWLGALPKIRTGAVHRFPP